MAGDQTELSGLKLPREVKRTLKNKTLCIILTSLKQISESNFPTAHTGGNCKPYHEHVQTPCQTSDLTDVLLPWVPAQAGTPSPTAR